MNIGTILLIILVIACGVVLYLFFIKPYFENKDKESNTPYTYKPTTTFKEDWDKAVRENNYEEMESLKREYATYYCRHRAYVCRGAIYCSDCVYFYPDEV